MEEEGQDVTNLTATTKSPTKEGFWTAVNRRTKDKGKKVMIDENINQNFCRNGFETLGVWKDSKVNPVVTQWLSLGM